MKKLLLLVCFISVFNLFAQEPEKPVQTTTTTTVVTTSVIPIEEKKTIKSDKKNEIRLDPFYLIFSGAFNANYERIIDEESGVGVTLLLSNGNDINTTFSVSPYYRLYFGKKPAAGFFFEGFAMYSTFRADQIIGIKNDNGIFFTQYEYKTVTLSDFALGLGLGGKWISRKGIIFEISAGVGRNLLNDYNKYDNINITGKGGISIGKRF